MAILCPGQTADQTVETAEKLRVDVAAAGMQGDCSQDIPTTISVGVAQYVRGENEHGLLSRADFALYRSKTAGRNRVTLAAATPAKRAA